MDETVVIPHPYKGLCLRLGRQEVNVHDVCDGTVLYGLYDDDADDAPYRCIGTYSKPVDDWINQAGRSIMDGAVSFSRIAEDPFELT